MNVRRAKPILAALTVWVGSWTASAQAEYVSFFPSGDASQRQPYQTAFATEGAAAAQARQVGYLMQPPAPGMMPPGAMPGAMPPGAMMPGMPPGAMPPGGMPPGAMPQQFGGPMPAGAGGMPPYGPGMGPMPAEAEMYGQGMMYGPEMYGHEGYDGYVEEGFGGRLGRGGILAGLVGPYLNGCCGPRWYNVSVDYLHMWREQNWSYQPFTSDGIPGLAPPVIVLDSDDLDFDGSSGVRVMLRHQIGAATNIEGGYFGLYGNSTAATVTSPIDNLFSVMSGYGNPPFFLGFGATDRSDLQSLRYDFDLHSAELNFRRQFQWGKRVQGSWMLGARYVGYTEDFGYFTQSTFNADFMDYTVDVTNDMFGFQLGGDLYTCLVPGLMLGGELKTGVYGNQAIQHTRIITTDLDMEERAEKNDAAFVLDARAGLNWQARPNLSITGGYQVLLIDGVALGVENFNATPPFVDQPARAASVGIDSNGTAFFHGFYSGIEWLW